jgi:magnesium chelatase family protein
MVALAYTVAFEGIEARLVEVQCAITPGIPAFSIVGLPDKAVSEARERVRAALTAMAIALPSKRITVNLSPADLPKEGSHFDLPIALALLAALEIVPLDDAAQTVALGELSLNGTLVPVVGALPAAMAAAAEERTLLCPQACGSEAAWVGAAKVIAPRSLSDVVRHFTGQAILPPAEPGEVNGQTGMQDLSEVKGQERAKRALEIAAAGRHHLLLIGSPGSGKSMLAARIPGILPPLSPEEALETSMIHSLSGLLDEGGINRERPFREPHHTASMAAIVGGGAGRNPERSAWPITACFSWMSSPNSHAPFWKHCATPSKPAKWWSPGQTPTSATLAALCLSRPQTPANAATCQTLHAPAHGSHNAERIIWGASRGH